MESRVWLVVLLLVGSLAAQLDTGSIIRRVRVRVVFVNGGCDSMTHVRLMGVSGPIAEGAVSDSCVAEFFNVPAGTYDIIATGQNFADTVSGGVAMNSAGAVDYEIKVRRNSEPERANSVMGASLISATDLAIPRSAQKEFEKGSELLAKRDLQQAIRRFNKAIAIYPAYASAYNGLGVLYSGQGEAARAREALQKAIDLNDHFAIAYMNLGLLHLSTGDYVDAETVLNKAKSFDPDSATTLTALTFAQFMNHRLDDAIATCRKAHTLTGTHAFVHQLAARAYEQKHDMGSAEQELELFLQEEPTGAQANIARKELGILQASSHPVPAQ